MTDPSAAPPLASLGTIILVCLSQGRGETKGLNGLMDDKSTMWVGLLEVKSRGRLLRDSVLRKGFDSFLLVIVPSRKKRGGLEGATITPPISSYSTVSLLKRPALTQLC